LVKKIGNSSKAFYVKTNNELSLIPYGGTYLIYEPMKLKYIGPEKYIQGRVEMIDTWLFEKIN
jgi:hypothetical protein